LNYSSVAHLSKQFKQVTGMSPSEFKKQQNSQRKGIDQI
ncbi:helix-turn-helix domain-containing protein, partial [Bacteroidota bacterium]|nr:helix-turn-helix domain-containing protein [Bacteroidota bacterium]